jgi:hypothetical protein
MPKNKYNHNPTTLHIPLLGPVLFTTSPRAECPSGGHLYRKDSGVWKDFQERTPLENILIGITEIEINIEK